MTKSKEGFVDRIETFDEFLAKQGLLAKSEDAALKQIIADQNEAAMKARKMTNSAIAARMKKDAASLTACSIRKIPR